MQTASTLPSLCSPARGLWLNYLMIGFLSLLASFLASYFNTARERDEERAKTPSRLLQSYELFYFSSHVFFCNLWLCCSNPGQVKTAQREGASPLMSALPLIYLPLKRWSFASVCCKQSEGPFPGVCSAGSVCKVWPTRSPGKKIPPVISLAAQKALHCLMPVSFSPQKYFPQAAVPGLCLCWCPLLQPRDAKGWELPTALKTCQSWCHQGLQWISHDLFSF